MDIIFGNFLIGGIFLMIGMHMFFSPPPFNHPQAIYREKFALKNKDVWNESNKYAGRTMIITGLISIIIGFLFNIIIPVSSFTGKQLIGINIVIININAFAMLFIYSSTNTYIKRIFDKDGNRRK